MSLLCTCSGCKHFRIVRDGDAGQGECKRFPPTLRLVPVSDPLRGQGLVAQSHYARTRTDWTCGEFEGVKP